VRSIKDSRINFKGQHFFIGMDVHKKQWTVSIRHNGLALKTFSMNPSPEMLRDYLEGHFPQGTYHVVYSVEVRSSRSVFAVRFGSGGYPASALHIEGLACHPRAVF
jgi:hypothetical protein